MFIPETAYRHQFTRRGICASLAALAAGCGGGSGASPSASAPVRVSDPQQASGPSTTVPVDDPVMPNAPFSHPELTTGFASAVSTMMLVENTRFGSKALGSGADNETLIRDAGELSRHYNPFQGEFDALGRYLGGTGQIVINSEIQTYNPRFDGGNHIFDADGLRLQATLDGGHFDSYLRGQIDTRSGGINVNAPARTNPLPTPLTAIGLKSSDLDRIEIGDVLNNSSYGLAVVQSKDKANGTITFEAVSGGEKVGHKGNYHLTFTKFGFVPVADAVVNGDRTVRLERPAPSSVMPGMYVRSVSRGSGGTGEPGGVDNMRVLRLSSDRRTVEFDRPVTFYPHLTPDNHSGLLFIPGLTSGQIWSKRSYGPQRSGFIGTAIEAEVTLPDMPHLPLTPAYTKTDVERVLASAPDIKWGYWPAVWLFLWRPDADGVGLRKLPEGTPPWAELDIVELFTRMGSGPSVWTGNLHDKSYHRATASPPPGARWVKEAAYGSLLDADSQRLEMPSSIANGRKVRFGVVYSDDKVTHYLNGAPLCESAWSVDSDYPHQLGLNVACGSLARGGPAALFFPQSDSQAVGQFMTVHSIRTWEATG